MAKFEIEFKPSVYKDLKDVPVRDVQKMLAKIDLLMHDARPPGSVKLSGGEYHRIRQGDYRIVYDIQDTKLVVVVIKVGHRREVYR